MEPYAFDPRIAQEIVTGRLLRLPTLQAMAERNGETLGDKLWEALKPAWEWHDTMSSDELQRRCGVRL